MPEDLYVVLRTLLMLLFLLIIARVLGRRTLSELTFYDFVIGLVIGHIGGSVITDAELFSIRAGLIAGTVATLWVLAINMLSLKSVPARKLIEAEPLMVMYKGKVLENNLKKRYYNVNDLLEMLREQGCFDPEQVEVALIESDGQLSVLKKPEYQTPTTKDFNLQNQNLSASYLAGKEVIIDGKLIQKNLEQSGLTTDQLHYQLRNVGITKFDDVILATITPDGKLYVDKRNDAQG
jgi:Predicted membrane protein